MALRHNDLRAIAVFACVLAGCSASTEPSDSPDSVPVPHLSLRTDFGLELLQGEVNLTPGDSLILLATVEGSPADYGVPGSRPRTPRRSSRATMARRWFGVQAS